MYELGYDMYFKNDVLHFICSASTMKKANIPEDF